MNPEEHSQIIETDARITDVVYDFSLKAIERATQHFARVDAKATTLTSVLGVIITILFTLAGKAFPGGKFLSGFGLASEVLLIVSIGLFLTSLGFCLSAFWLRDIKDIPLVRELIVQARVSERKPGDEVELKKRLIGSLSRVDYSYCFEASAKTSHLRTGSKWMIGGFVVLALAGVCFIVHVSVTTYERSGTTASGEYQKR